MKAPQKSLKAWTKQKWRTKSGKPSAKTGERYLPEKAIKALSSDEYAATTAAKRKGTAKGKQFVKQPKGVAKKVKPYRAAEGALMMKKPGPNNQGLKKLPKNVRNKMGYMNKGGMTKKTGYNKGGMANCGASVAGTQNRGSN